MKFHTSLRGMKKTDRRELINTNKNNTALIISILYRETIQAYLSFRKRLLGKACEF